MNRDKHDMDNSNINFDYLEAFNPDNYLYFYDRTINPEITDKQVDFLIDQLKLTPSMRILDLACGQGRHTNALATRGFSVVGVDINENLLGIAKSEAKRKGLDVQYIPYDMRNLPYSNEFDRVLLLYTSFGYFNDKDNEKVLENIATALKSDGLLCFDTHNRDMYLKYFHPYTVTEKGRDLMINMNSFDPKTGRWNCRRIILKEDKRTEVHISVRLYNFTEIRDVLENVGFNIVNVFGGWERALFLPTSHQMVIIAKKE